MDINKIQFFSITNNDISTRVYLTLEEDDTISVKIENPLDSIAYPLLTISYKIRYTQNNLFTQNKDYFLVINGQATKIDLIDIAYSDDSVTVSFLMKNISAIEYYKQEIFSKFFDSNGTPIIETIVTGGTKFIIPRHTESVTDYLIASSYDDYTVIINSGYPEDNEIVLEEAVAIWEDKNILVRNITTSTLNNQFGTISPVVGDNIRIFNFVETEQNKHTNNIPNTQVVSTSQFGAVLGSEGNVTSIVNIIPDEMYVKCTIEMVDVAISGITFLIPCILLCKSYKMVDTNDIYQQGWYVLPLIKEFYPYVKRVNVTTLPTSKPAVGTVILSPEYKVTMEPLKYYNTGDDVDNTMFNPFVENVVNGKYTPIVFNNEQISVFDIISDICYLKKNTLIDNNINKDLPMYSLTTMKQTLNDSGYEYKAADLEIKNIDFVDNKGFNLVEKTGNKKRRVTQWANCVIPIQIHQIDLVGGRKMPLLTTSAANFVDAKYDDNKEVIKPNSNILQYTFEGYLSTITNTDTNTFQNIIPKTFIYNNTEFHLLGVDNYNLRNGYITGTCYRTI